ncbi:MAG TPA: DUF3089 domain-containing protein [Solirubrobacteraceae bacterium]
MRGLLLAVAATLLTAAGAAPAAAEVVWLCKPGMADDPCALALDTTVRAAGAPDAVQTPARGAREVDCFYVYPTVSNQLSPNTDKARDPELVSIAKYQAARFSQQCRVFAPVYRQATLLALAAGTASLALADRQLAYADVLEAWREYLAKHNDGRGVVLIGHSQGTGMLRQLLRREIEAHPKQLRRVVAALLIGNNVTVAAGRVIDGDFRHTPLCTRRAQVGCVVAFSSFASDPPSNARFGRSAPPPANNPSTLPGGPGYEIACTDPRPLAGWDGPLRVMTPSEPYAFGPIAAGIALTSLGMAPTAPTTWVVAPDRYEGGCRKLSGAHVLRYDPLPGPSRRPLFFPEPSWGTHLIDVNLALEPMVDLVGQQAARWAHPEIRLTRRCVRGRLRTAIAGRDREFVQRSAVRRRGTRLRATVTLRYGQPQRLVLERSRPRC